MYKFTAVYRVIVTANYLKLAGKICLLRKIYCKVLEFIYVTKYDNCYVIAVLRILKDMTVGINVNIIINDFTFVNDWKNHLSSINYF